MSNPRGKIRYYNAERGWGFIHDFSAEGDVYFHISQVVSDLTAPLFEGERVDFRTVMGERRVEAREVVRISLPEIRYVTGSVIWYKPERRMGYLKLENSPDVFVHQSDLWHPDVKLTRGEIVRFCVRPGRGGKPRAFNVEPI